MHRRGALNLLCFLSVWLGSTFAPFVALVCVYYRIYWPVYIFVAHISFRYIFPAKRWDFVRQALSNDGRSYFTTTEIVFEKGATAPKANSKVITSVAPHGILTCGWSFMVGSGAFATSNTKWLVAPLMMKLPFLSDLMRWTGCDSADPKSMHDIMKAGCNIGIIPGGFNEISLYKRHHHRVFFKARKGFIKYALQYGYSVQPTYCFGEELTYWAVNIFPKSVSVWLNKQNIPTAVFMGKYLFMPDDNIKFTVVVGKTIPFPHIEKPSVEDVDKYHKVWMDASIALFNAHKGEYAATGEAAELEVY